MQLANITHILCSANQQPLCMYVLAVQGPLLTRRFAKMQSHTVVRRFMVKDEFIQMMRFHHNVTFPEAERLCLVSVVRRTGSSEASGCPRSIESVDRNCGVALFFLFCLWLTQLHILIFLFCSCLSRHCFNCVSLAQLYIQYLRKPPCQF